MKVLEAVIIHKHPLQSRQAKCILSSEFLAMVYRDTRDPANDTLMSIEMVEIPKPTVPMYLLPLRHIVSCYCRRDVGKTNVFSVS